VTQRDRSDQDIADKEAMRQLQAGEDEALSRIMARWKEPLLSFLYRYTSNWSVAVDLTEEAFVRVYQSRLRYKPSGTFSNWLFAIAANLARNEARWRRRHPGSALVQAELETTGSSSIPEPASAEPGPDDNADHEDRAKLVRAAIGKLRHDLRTAVLLFEYEGLSHKEIAEVMGCSEKAVETRLYRARNQLRDLLSEQL